jgi:hypothetical protein
MRTRISISLTTIIVCVAAPAAAQDTPRTVSGIVDHLVTSNQRVPTGEPERDRAAAETGRDTITRALLANFASLPIGSSSGGFVYRLNPELGTMERATESFGTFFVERALTAGHGRASFGASAAGAAYNRLGGLPLREGIVTVANQFRDQSEPYDVDTLRLRISSNVMTVFGSVGITDRLEIGAAVPFVRLTLEGDRMNRYTRQCSTCGNVTEVTTPTTATATASGIADIAVRAKYAVVDAPGGGVAAAVEARLPTGDERNLLGAGSAAWRFMAIGSMDRGRAALHGNAGVVRAGFVSGDVNELTFGGAASFALHPRMTLSGELLGRRVSGLGRMSLVAAPHPIILGANTLRLLADDSPVFVSTAIGGLKWNVTHALVVAGHIARPLSDSGLTAPLSGTISLEYAVGR